MAPPVTAHFGKFRVQIGSGTGPIVYAAPCGFTSKSLVLTNNLSEVSIPDCDDPDKPISVGRDVESTSAAITGEGVAAASAIPVWRDAFTGGVSVPVKIEIEYSTGTQTITGYFQIESLEFGAEQGGRVMLNVSMQSDGELTYSDDFA